LCAIIVNNSDIAELHQKFEDIRKSNGFSSSEMKSSKVGNDYKRRSRIISMLMPIPFRIALLIADKQEFSKDSPLTEYKPTFIKYLHQRLYDQLYHVYPKLRIIEDEIGTSEFQESFKKYVAERRPGYNLLNDYDFDYTDSKDEILVQLADIIGGSIYKSLDDPTSPNYLEMLRGKIISFNEFPSKKEPYWGNTSSLDCQFDSEIYTLAVKCARDFIDQNQKDDSIEKRAQVAFLMHLLFCVNNISPTRYISSYEALDKIKDYTGERLAKNFLFRKVVAPLRDSGVILASSNKGYKIPISAEDITIYLNQTHSIVEPMLHRMDICRKLIMQSTAGRLDVLSDPAFTRYTKYFD
jgi:hypothetical protein